MTEYRLASGRTLTDEDLDKMVSEYEAGLWAGKLSNIHAGPAAVADEPLVTVTVKFPKSMVDAIDGLSRNRSDYVRRAVAVALSA